MEVFMNNKADAALKRFYDDMVPYIVQRNSMLYAMCTKKVMSAVGEGTYKKYGTGTDVIGGSDFARAQGQDEGRAWNEMKFTPDRYYQTITIDDYEAERHRNDEGSVIRLVKDRAKAAWQAAAAFRASCFYGDGYGDLGVVDSIVNTGSERSVTFSDGFRANRLIQVGQRLSFGTKGAALKLAGTVNAFPVIGKSQLTSDFKLKVTFLTSQALPSIAAGDIAVSGGENTQTRGFYRGLEAWIPTAAISSTDSFFGVNRSLINELVPQVYTAPANTAIVDVMLNALTFNMVTTGEVDVIVMSPSNSTKLAIELKDQIRYPRAKNVRETATVGWAAFEILSPVTQRPIPVVVDTFMPDDKLYFLRKGDFKIRALHDGGKDAWYYSRDGVIYLRSATKAAMEARIFSYNFMTCDDPSSQLVADISAL